MRPVVLLKLLRMLFIICPHHWQNYPTYIWIFMLHLHCLYQLSLVHMSTTPLVNCFLLNFPKLEFIGIVPAAVASSIFLCISTSTFLLSFTSFHSIMYFTLDVYCVSVVSFSISDIHQSWILAARQSQKQQGCGVADSKGLWILWWKSSMLLYLMIKQCGNMTLRLVKLAILRKMQK